jgi:hypothetical protein
MIMVQVTAKKKKNPQSRKVFSECGRLFGFRIQQKQDKVNFGMRMEFGPQAHLVFDESKYQSSFEDLWKWTKDEWKKHNKYSTADMVSYAMELKFAKRIYIKDLYDCQQKQA